MTMASPAAPAGHMQTQSQTQTLAQISTRLGEFYLPPRLPPPTGGRVGASLSAAHIETFNLLQIQEFFRRSSVSSSLPYRDEESSLESFVQFMASARAAAMDCRTALCCWIGDQRSSVDKEPWPREENAQIRISALSGSGPVVQLCADQLEDAGGAQEWLTNPSTVLFLDQATTITNLRVLPDQLLRDVVPGVWNVNDSIVMARDGKRIRRLVPADLDFRKHSHLPTGAWRSVELPFSTGESGDQRRRPESSQWLQGVGLRHGVERHLEHRCLALTESLLATLRPFIDATEADRAVPEGSEVPVKGRKRKLDSAAPTDDENAGVIRWDHVLFAATSRADATCVGLDQAQFDRVCRRAALRLQVLFPSDARAAAAPTTRVIKPGGSSVAIHHW